MVDYLHQLDNHIPQEEQWKVRSSVAVHKQGTTAFDGSELPSIWVPRALERAARAAAIAVSRPGASTSVPFAAEVDG